jgi:UDP-glucose 4-epimerase
MRILITGGVGYLGGRLAQYLVNNSSHTILLGTRNNFKNTHWLPQAKVVITKWDSEVELENICSKIDILIHLSGMNSSDCFQDSKLAMEVNCYSTIRLLESSIKQKVKRFIYLSTAHVYDSPLIGHINEKTLTKNKHPYALSNKAGEDAVRLAHYEGRIEGIVMRLSNSFGAPIDSIPNCWSLVTNDLCRQAIENNSMVLNNPESQSRDFISITNVCRAIEHLMNLSGKQIDDGLFNVGGEWSQTTLEIARLLSIRINLLLGKKITIHSKILNTKKQSVDLNFDISKIKLTGFNLINNRDEEFDSLIRFCQKNFGV